MKLFGCLALLVACGPEGASTHDAGPRRDGAVPFDGTLLTDAGTPAIAVNCVDYPFRETHTDGSGYLIVQKRAVIAEVALGDRFLITACYDASSDPTAPVCSTGSSCTGSSWPGGKHCYSTEAGEFVGGQLVVFCGYRQTTYAAGGAQSATYGYDLNSIRVLKL